MPNPTFKLIASVEVGSGGASSIDFTSISADYTDLKLVSSFRSDRSGSNSASVYLSFNGSTANFTGRDIEGAGSGTVYSGSQTNSYFGIATAASTTANTFTNWEIYIPNYAGSNYKSFSVENAHENNATAAYAYLWAGLWSQTAAITSISLAPTGYNFVEGSTAYLYGIKNS